MLQQYDEDCEDVASIIECESTEGMVAQVAMQCLLEESAEQILNAPELTKEEALAELACQHVLKRLLTEKPK